MAIRNLPPNTSLHGAWIGNDGMQYIASSCFVMCIKTPIDGIPEALSNGCQRDGLEDVLSNAKSDCTVSVAMPSIESIKTAYGPVHKAMKKSLLSLGIGMPILDLDEVLPLLKAVDFKTVSVSASRPERNPVLFSSEELDFAIIPVWKEGLAIIPHEIICIEKEDDTGDGN